MIVGYLHQGQWHIETVLPTKNQNYFRTPTTFRDKITADASSGYLAEPNRYHLYVSLSCPWAHRVLLMRQLRGLEAVIPVSVADPVVKEQGWTFPENPEATRYLWQIYVQAQADYTGRATVPVLWDHKRKTIVNNESQDIVRMLDVEFAAFAQATTPYCTLETENTINQHIRDLYLVNNGVYRVGFAQTQAAREDALDGLFNALGDWEVFFSTNRFLGGDNITEADWCLFVTLIRFDCAYYGAFRCNRRRLADYSHLQRYLWELYAVPGVAQTCDFLAICRHYYRSYPCLPFNQIIPIGMMLEPYPTESF